MTTPICGHDREALRCVLGECAQRDKTGTMTMRMCATCIDTACDPAKLAAIIAGLLQERGFNAYADRQTERVEYPCYSVRSGIFNEDIRIVRLDEFGFSAGRASVFDMPAARRFALALLDAPADANVEQMIAEVSR